MLLQMAKLSYAQALREQHLCYSHSHGVKTNTGASPCLCHSAARPSLIWPIINNGGVNSCIVSVPNTPLPEGLLLVNDHTFSLRLSGSQERTFIGQHYMLFTPTEMYVDDFNERYLRLISPFVPCTMKANGAASLASLTDPHVMLADELSAVAVMEQLAAMTSDPETKLFATLFALDMRACKTVFEDVVEGCYRRVAMVAAALDEFVARDAMVREAAMDAQEALEVALPGYKPLGCKYEPSWVSMHGL
eukprot:gene19665-26351_t